MKKSAYTFEKLDRCFSYHEEINEDHVSWACTESSIWVAYKGYHIDMDCDNMPGNCGMIVANSITPFNVKDPDILTGLLYGIKEAMDSLYDKGYGKVIMSDSSVNRGYNLSFRAIAEFLGAQEGTTVPNPNHGGQTKITLWEYDTK